MNATNMHGFTTLDVRMCPKGLIRIHPCPIKALSLGLWRKNLYYSVVKSLNFVKHSENNFR